MGLNDRLYEKRKAAALDLEGVIRKALTERNNEKIKQIIDQLSREYAYAVHQPNARNGGLIGLAAAAIALGQNEVAGYLEDIIHPVLACFGDQDARVRYYACESLYNIAKVAKGEILLYFNEVFDVLSKLAADSDTSVKNGADLLDRLIKDIIFEKATSYVGVIQKNPELAYKNATQATYKDANGQTLQLQPAQDAIAFSLPKFIPLLMERMNAIDPFTRVFLVSWVTLLNSVPDLELVSYLPAFLGGLLNFLNDSHSDVRVLTQSALDIFLHEIRRVSEIQKLVKEQKDKSKKHVLDTSTPTKIHDGSSIVFSEPVAKLTQESKYVYENETIENDHVPAIEESGTDTVQYDQEKNERTQDSNNITIGEEVQSQKEEDHDNQSEHDEPNEHDGELYIPGQYIFLDYPKIIEILISYIDSTEEKIQSVVLTWLAALLEISPLSFISYLPKLLAVLLVTMENQEGSTSKESSKEVNERLLQLISQLSPEDEKKINYSMLINTLTLHFLSENESTKVAALDWLRMLHGKSRKHLLEHGDFFTTLLKALSDPSEEVIHRDLQLISDIAYESDDENFRHLMVKLLDLFKDDQKLLETRGNFILRRLCISLNPIRVYQTLAKVLEIEDDTTFVGIIIQILNNNLITAPELSNLRKILRNLEEKDDLDFFASLFKAWSHNAPATLSLCLLSQAYELAYSVLQIFVDFEISVNTLVQLDILVQLLESPVFTRVRLQLLEPEKYPYLYKCLYGILMLLPQSTAFTTLKNRLSSVTVLNTFTQQQASQNSEPQLSSSESAVSLVRKTAQWDELLTRFRKIQLTHEERLLKDRSTLSKPRALPKYSVTPAIEKENAFETVSTPQKTDTKQATRKLSGRSFVLKRFGGEA